MNNYSNTKALVDFSSTFGMELAMKETSASDISLLSNGESETNRTKNIASTRPMAAERNKK